MKISTKGIYALEAMIELNSSGSGHCISIREIAERRNCSTKYLEQIFKLLKKAGLVQSLRGKDGGYKLNKSSAAITAKDIIIAVEEKLDPVICLSQSCDRSEFCRTQSIWQGMQREIFDVLESKTLAELTSDYLQERGG